MYSNRTIIIGGGTAGCILASRLCRAGTAVHLFEAGPQPTTLSSVQARMPLQRVLDRHAVLREGKADNTRKLLHTVPQGACANRRLPFVAGTVLGGRSALSEELSYARPPSEEFDAWKMKQFKGESLDSFFAEFETEPKLEDTLRRDSEWDRDMCAAYKETTVFSPFTSAFVRSAVAESFQTSEQLTLKDHPQGIVMLPKKRIQPSSKSVITTSNQYLAPIQQHKFFGQLLTVQSDTRIDTVKFDNQNRAHAVGYTDAQGICQTLDCDRVILCAGALETPRILLASGIGSPQAVGSFGEPCRIPLNEVGKNLFDQVQVSTRCASKNRMSASPMFNVLVQKLIQLEWGLWGSGWGSCSLEGPRIYNRATTSDKFSAVADYGVFLRNYLESTAGKVTHGCTLDARLLRPQSRGEVSFRESAEGTMKMHVNPNYLSEESDVSVLAEALQCADTISNSKAMLECVRENEASRSQDVIRAQVVGLGEFGGTCALGSVLKPDFLVENTRNIYVCDASAVPVPMSAGLSSTVMIMAHRLADSLSIESRYV